MEDLPLGAMGSKPSSPRAEDASVNLNLPAPLSSAVWSKEGPSAGIAALPVDLPSIGVAKNDDTSTSTVKIPTLVLLPLGRLATTAGAREANIARAAAQTADADP